MLTQWAYSLRSLSPSENLPPGEVGFFVATIKNVADTKIGDTVTENDASPCDSELAGFEELKPMVFAGIYTVDSHEHTLLRDALEKASA